MTLIDDSLQSNDDSVAGLSVVIFRPDPALFPDVHSEDEVVQCRHMRVQVFQGGLQALSTNWSAFTVFARDQHGQWVARPSREISPGEQAQLDRISARTGHTAALLRNSPTKSNALRPQLTIDSITPGTYFDLVAQVVQVLPAKQTQMTSILLTDYTANPAIRVNPADFGLASDYEHRLLLTSFWDNFAARAAALHPGQIIRVVNLRPKLITEDGAGPGGLVAGLHGDRSNAEKIFLLSGSVAEVITILERKRELFGERAESATGPLTRKSPPREATVIIDKGTSANKGAVSGVNISRAHVRRPLLFDTQPAREEMAGLTIATGGDNGLPAMPTSSVSKSPTKFHPLTTILHAEIPVTAIGTVIQATECPAKFVIKGRVQKVLADRTGSYTRRQCVICQKAYSRAVIDCASCREPLRGWTFMFALVITDGFDTLTVIVADREAIRFLNGLQPNGDDGVGDSAASLSLAYIEDVLGKLADSAIPASFCIKSYQVGKERRYRLFDTILAV